MTSEPEDDALRVLVFAPTGRDAPLTVSLLADAGIDASACPTPSALVSRMRRDVGALLLTEEAFDEEGASAIVAELEKQPTWSAVPLLVMTSDEAGAERLMSSFGERANLTVLQRPIRLAMLASAVRAALRARERQYETRELLERLREADRQKDEFLATVSHELRTPLNAILGWTTLMRQESCEAPRHERGLAVLERNAEAQKTIIEDLLDVSRIITGKVRLELGPTDLRAAALAAVESVRPAASARAIAIDAPASREPVLVRGDFDRLQQIAWNLVSNAVKFTPQNGRVTVDVERADGAAVLRVTDSGNGISPEFLPHLFERFRQADGSTTRRHGGLGLGLAIVRHLAELHGGTVRAESAGTGRGSTFVVTIPATDVGLDEEGARAAPDALANLPSLEGVRVLVVDDSEDALEMMKSLLASSGAEVRVAASAQAGLDELIAWRPDVVLSDVAMPDRDGYWLVEQVRSLAPEAGGLTPAVALTALADRADRTRALVAGFQQHLRKPATFAELTATVAALVGRRARPAK